MSHVKDVDGCVSAAIIRLATKSRFLLTDYGRINAYLRKIKDPYDIVYICDLGMNNTYFEEFVRIRRFAELTYIDHHYLDKDLRKKLEQQGVTIVHDSQDCAGALAYNLFHENLPREASILACYAAISDRLEDGPIAQKLIQKHDRDFILFETMMLSYALERANISQKRRIVNNLSRLTYPHQIDDVPRLALEQANRIALWRRELPSIASKLNNVAFVEAKGDSTGPLANLLIDVCETTIGIAYNIDEVKGISDLSIRGNSSTEIDLGNLTSQLAEDLGGFGGGHPKASGARIPASRLTEFIHSLAQYVKTES